MIGGMFGNDLLLDGGQQLLRLSQGQPRIRYGTEAIGWLERHHIVAARLNIVAAGSVAKSGIDGVQPARRSRRITSGGNPE